MREREREREKEKYTDRQWENNKKRNRLAEREEEINGQRGSPDRWRYMDTQEREIKRVRDKESER